jgi:hypothetical protein
LDVDPLRALAVLAFDDGLRYFCGEDCGLRGASPNRYHLCHL